MVQAAVADIVRPAVATEDPDGFLRKIILVSKDRLGQIDICHTLSDNALELCDIFVGSCLALLGLVALIEPCIRRRGQSVVGATFKKLLGFGDKLLAHGILSEQHAQTVLRVIFEQGVGPCGTATLFVHRVRRRGSRTAPNRRATRCV